MSMVRSFMAMTFLMLLLSASPLFSQTAADNIVITTDRLNLRACPNTSGCPVLRTLPLGTSLKVAESRGEWLRVTTLEEQESGWVHSRYTRAEDRSSLFALSQFSDRSLLAKMFAGLCLVGAFIVTVYAGPKMKPEFTGQQFFAWSAFSVLLGAVVLLNQFGPIIGEMAYPHIQLDRVSLLWEVNDLAGDYVGYSQVVVFLVAIVAGVAAAAPMANKCKVSFLQGVCTGFSALPVLAMMIALVGAIGCILALLFKLIGLIMGFLIIPFVWIWVNLMAPILRFLSIPFVWLWENILRDIVHFLAIPFLWLWAVVFKPVCGFIYKYLLMPIGALFAGIFVVLVALFPVGVVGAVFIESIRSAVRGPLNTLGLFSQGVAIGFLLFDAVLLAGLNAYGVLHALPPISLLVPVALQVVVFLRLLGPNDAAAAQACPVFQGKLVSYWSSSRLELLSTCVLAPIGLFATLQGDHPTESGDLSLDF